MVIQIHTYDKVTYDYTIPTYAHTHTHTWMHGKLQDCYHWGKLNEGYIVQSYLLVLQIPVNLYFKIKIRENVSLKKSSHIILPIAEPKMLKKGELTLSLIFLQDLYLPLSLDDSDSLGDSMWRRRESRMQMQAYCYNRVLLLKCPTGLLVLSNFYFVVVVVTFKNTL